MNVLVSGDLSSLTPAFVFAFLKEKFKVVLVSSSVNAAAFQAPNVSVHQISPSADHFAEIATAYKFDVVIYLPTREEQHLASGRQNNGDNLDGLLNVLEVCKKEGIQRIFYISSTEVYGDQEYLFESEGTLPASVNGLSLRTGEQYCLYYSERFGIHPIILRVPFLYGPDEKATFLHQAIKNCVERKKVVFPGEENTLCNFLHTADVVDFILRALDMPVNTAQAVNLSSADSLTSAQLAELLKMRFPEAKFEFQPSARIYTRVAGGLNARRKFDWVAEHSLIHEMPGVIEEVEREPRQKKYLLERIKSRFPGYQRFLKWSELILGALGMHYLSMLSRSVVEFGYVDFRLAYVVLLGGMYGTQAGLVASILAGISVLIGLSMTDLNWVELVYNVSNWLPFALYISAGMIAGYFHDKKESDARFLEEQAAVIKEKYKFLYELYQEVIRLKDQFHKQLVGSRDSFGRIYRIASELDTLEAEEVIFRALHVLEDVMDNRSIAIYSIHQASCYARLEIHSSDLAGQVEKSLVLGNYPDLMNCIEQSQVYQNRLMKPGLPAYFIPIRNEGVTVAGVAVWKAGFDQNSLYYSNLLSVVCGLIQSSLNRVAVFMNANARRYYIPGTKILLPENFARVLKVKHRMKENKLGDYLLVKVEQEFDRQSPQAWERLNMLISGVVRAEDYAGVSGDGTCYILFAQANQENATAILRRLGQRGLTCRLVNEQFPNLLASFASPPASATAFYGSARKTGSLNSGDLTPTKRGTGQLSELKS